MLTTPITHITYCYGLLEILLSRCQGRQAGWPLRSSGAPKQICNVRYNKTLATFYKDSQKGYAESIHVAIVPLCSPFYLSDIQWPTFNTEYGSL